MTRPADIDQQTWDAAARAFGAPFDPSAMTAGAVIEVAARAILAAKAEQREADAKLSDAEFRNLFNDSGRHIAGRIAAAIRKGAA